MLIWGHFKRECCIQNDMFGKSIVEKINVPTQFHCVVIALTTCNLTTLIKDYGKYLMTLINVIKCIFKVSLYTFFIVML